MDTKSITPPEGWTYWSFLRHPNRRELIEFYRFMLICRAMHEQTHSDIEAVEREIDSELEDIQMRRTHMTDSIR